MNIYCILKPFLLSFYRLSQCYNSTFPRADNMR